MTNTIGHQIKLLRKAKGVTQEEMGTTLGISYQAVSKWENNTALPDVQMIPKIAEYFGVTTDELFGYKLNALTNKERLIQFMKNNQILSVRPVELKHGGSAEFFVDTGKFGTNAQLAKIGEYFADCVKEHHLEFDTLFGMAYHGIAFSCATATALFNKYGVTVNYCYGRKMPDKEGNIVCGHQPRDGDRVVVVDDVLTTGITLDEKISELKKLADVTVVAVIVIVNRKQQTGTVEQSGEDRIREKYDAEVYSMLTDEDIEAFLR